MTDARIPERYLLDRRVARLSDSAFRAWVTATLWSVANRTDGRVDAADLPLVPGLTGDAADALVAAGLWASADDGWFIEGFADEQTSRSELQALDDARRHARERKRAQRERERTSSTSAQSRDGHVTNSVTSRGTTQDRTRTGIKPPSSAPPSTQSRSVKSVNARANDVLPDGARETLTAPLADRLGAEGWRRLRDEIADRAPTTVRDRDAYAVHALRAEDGAEWVARAWSLLSGRQEQSAQSAHAHDFDANSGYCGFCGERREVSA